MCVVVDSTILRGVPLRNIIEQHALALDGREKSIRREHFPRVLVPDHKVAGVLDVGGTLNVRTWKLLLKQGAQHFKVRLERWVSSAAVLDYQVALESGILLQRKAASIDATYTVRKVSRRAPQPLLDDGKL
jgi:hypothetical protein